MAVLAQNNQNQQDDQNQPMGAAPTPAATPSAPSASPMQQAAAPQPKGSGRFTNIQKYIGANQGAGERLASGVGRKIEAQVNPKAQQAQSQNEQIKQSVQSAQGTLGQGQQLKSQVEKEDFDVTGFAAQQPNVQQFTQFRTGQAIDEQALQNQALANQQAAQAAQETAQGFNTQLGTEQGRGQLLKQSFSPTRNYSMGQQRLDNLFLSQATPQLQNIQSGLRSTSETLGGVLNENQLKQQAIKDLATQEQELASGLTGAISTKEQGLESALQGRIGEVNTQRAAEREKYNQFVNNLLLSGQGQKVENPLDESLINEAGLKLGQQTFNVFKNPMLTGNELLNISQRDAQNIQDVAQQADVDKYKALASLGGFEPAKLTKVGELEKAAAFRTGEGSIQNRVQDAQKKFLEDAIKQNLVGSGSQNWKSKDFLRGKKGTETASATLNLNDILGGDYQAAMTNQSDSKANTVAQQMFQGEMGGLEDGVPLAIGNAAAGTTGIARTITNALPSVFGDPNAGKQSRARTAAQQQANQDVMNKLNAYLQSQGFDQYLGSSGISTGSTKVEDYGYGQEDKSNAGLYNMLKNLPKVT